MKTDRQTLWPLELLLEPNCHCFRFRTGHTQSGLVACGKGNYEKTTCRTFKSGTWTLSHTIERRRDGHTSWDHDGDIYLLGGVSPETGTSDRVHRNGGSEKSFDLNDGGTRLKLENMYDAKSVYFIYFSVLQVCMCYWSAGQFCDDWWSGDRTSGQPLQWGWVPKPPATDEPGKIWPWLWTLRQQWTRAGINNNNNNRFYFL